MMFTLRYDPRSLQDLRMILDTLREFGEQLPFAFRNELAALIADLDKQPLRWPVRKASIRRAKLTLSKRFVHYVDYQEEEEKREILILQIIHQRANPSRWR
jgi:plasmid stabilization system protein ParE